jgi:hypothetical protein
MQLKLSWRGFDPSRLTVVVPETHDLVCNIN